MGGSGSTRWGWHTKKQTIEDGLTLHIQKLIKVIMPPFVFEQRRNWSGVIQWTYTRSGESAGRMGYQFVWNGSHPLLTLDYTVNGQPVRYDVRLATTPCHYGGVRYWFACPRCHRRVGCLYLPPGAIRFYCRKCHDLAYTSSQEAHQYDRLGRSLGIDFAAFERAIKMDRIVDKWIRGERLTKSEKRKLKSHGAL